MTNPHLSYIFPLKWSKIIQNAKFWPFHTFSKLFPPKWSKMIWNAQFWLFCTFPLFSHQSGLKWARMPNFGHFTLFHIYSHSKSSKLTQDSQFWSFCTFSHLFPPKLSKMIENAQFWSFHSYLHSFLTIVVWNDLKWSWMPNFDCSALFPSFPIKVAQNNLEGLNLALLHCFPIFNYNIHRFNSEWRLCCWQLCHKPYGFLVSKANKLCYYQSLFRAWLLLVLLSA